MRDARSFLVVPATKVDHYLAHVSKLDPQSAPDAVIVDLEDSVAPQAKDAARSLLRGSFAEDLHELRIARVLIKINGASTEDFDKDLALIREIAGRNLGVAMAKVEAPEELDRVHDAVQTGGGAQLFPAIETLAGYDRRSEIFERAAQLNVSQVAFGAGDMATSLGIERDTRSDLLRMVFCELVLAARRAGLSLIDSPARILPNARASERFEHAMREECEQAKRNGASGKLAVHPKQVPVIHRVFDPHSELRHAQEILEQFRRAEANRSLVSASTGEYMGTPTLRLAEERIRRNRGA